MKYTYSGVGAGQGGGGGLVTDADVYVRLVPRGERDRSQQEIEAVLRAEVKRIVGANVYISGTGMGGGGKQIQLQLKGPEPKVLERLAGQIAELARKVPGAVDVGLSTRGARPEMEVVVDRDLAAAVGITVGQVAQALRPAFAGLEVGDWVDPGGEARKVMVRFTPEARVSRADLERVPLVLQGANGATIVPLGQVARIQQGTGPNQVDHLDTDRVITIGANVEGRPLSAVVQGINKELAAFDLPAGYTISQGGETEDQEEVFGRVLVSLGIAVMLMYLVLVVQFQSFLDPIPVMASLPLSLIGVMLALLVTGSTLNIMSMIGVILLMGIVAKNAILLIDFAKWSEEKGMERHAAIIEAGGTRLRPILMTSVAIIAGMLPVAIGWGEGGDFRAPLGRAVIGGVLTSTLLTLLVIPTFYDILAGWREGLGKRLKKRLHRGH